MQVQSRQQLLRDILNQFSEFISRLLPIFLSPSDVVSLMKTSKAVYSILSSDKTWLHIFRKVATPRDLIPITGKAKLSYSLLFRLRCDDRECLTEYKECGCGSLVCARDRCVCRCCGELTCDDDVHTCFDCNHHFCATCLRLHKCGYQCPVCQKRAPDGCGCNEYNGGSMCVTCGVVCEECCMSCRGCSQFVCGLCVDYQTRLCESCV